MRTMTSGVKPGPSSSIVNVALSALDPYANRYRAGSWKMLQFVVEEVRDHPVDERRVGRDLYGTLLSNRIVRSLSSMDGS
jgi:hypothetical protein